MKAIAYYRVSRQKRKGYLELGQHSLGLNLIETALKRVASRDLYAQARCLYFLQNAYAMLDRLPQQQEALRLFELLGIYRERLPLMLDLSYRAFYKGSTARGAQLLRDVIELAPRHGDPRIAEALIIRAEIALLHGQNAHAVADLDLARKSESKHGRSRLNLVIDALQAEALWRAGEWSVGRFEQFSEALEPSPGFEQVVTDFYRGMCAYLRRDPVAATLFQTVISGPPLLDSFRLRSHAFLLAIQAETAPLTEDDFGPLHHLMNTIGGEFALTLDAGLLAALYQESALRGLGGRPVTRLAGVSHVSQSKLEVKTLGTFELRYKGDVLTLNLAKAQELLAYLALNGAATRETLMDALWGDHGSVSYFKQAVLSLRKALQLHLPAGVEGVSYHNGHYSLFEGALTTVDAEHVLSAAQSQQPEDWVRAAEVYQGAFLARCDSPWVEEMRVAVQDAALFSVLLLADQQRPSSVQAAEEQYARALEIEPLSERAWEGLLHCLEQQRAIHRLELARKQFRRVFLRELGIDPLVASA